MTQGQNDSAQDEISVQELAALLKDKADFCLLDVREPFEYDICNLQGKLIPLNELPTRLQELDKNKLTIVHCHLGGRSARAVAFLKTQVFTKVKNLTGGILRYADEIDPRLQKY